MLGLGHYGSLGLPTRMGEFQAFHDALAIAKIRPRPIFPSEKLLTGAELDRWVEDVLAGR